MLDLEALVAEMDRLAGDVAASARETLRRRDLACQQVEVARAVPHLREALQSLNKDMALPAEGRDMGEVHPFPVAEEYTILATDGSQVAPDYHHVAPWYVVNVGSVVLRHGPVEERKPSILASHPTLFPPTRHATPDPSRGTQGEYEDERTADARAAAPAMRSRLEVDRLEAEIRRATHLVRTEADPERTVLLLDGPLIQWRMINDIKPEADKERIKQAFREMLGTARQARVAVAGYISRSRAVEWVTLLRASMCPDLTSPLRKLCPACQATLSRPYEEPPEGTHCGDLAGVRDVEFTALRLTEPGMRTEVLELKSKVWTETTGDDGTAGFFYLNTGPETRGGEIARVETPKWVWEDDQLMERLHAALWDQCDAGHGYPMVLSEAHEAAVVRAPDREAFYALVERVLSKRGVDHAATSAKALSKRRPMA